MPPTRTLNTSRPPDRLQVTSGGPRNQPRNHSIVQAHPVRTIGVLGEVLEGSLGVPWRSPGALGIIPGGAWGPWGIPGSSLGVPRGSLADPWGALGVPGGSLGGAWGVPGGFLGRSVGEPGWALKNIDF